MTRPLGLLMLLLVLLPMAALAQAPSPAWPTQTVRIVTAAGAGSQSDLFARGLSDELARRWGRDVVIENRPGVAGTASVAKSTDGHTLLLAANAHVAIESFTHNIGFDPVKDFVPVALVGILPGVFVANPETGPKTLAELIALAKASPGKLNYASVGLGSTSAMGIELLKAMAGIDLVHVPMKSLPDTHVGVMRNDTQLTMTFYSAAGDLIASGKLRPLAIAGRGRTPTLPDVPTVEEAGVPGYKYLPWFGFIAPAATPSAVVAKVAADVGEAARLPAFMDRFTKLGVEVAPLTPDEFAALFHADAERFSKLFGKAK